MRGMFGEMSLAFERFKLLVIIKARAIDDGFELVESVKIFIILGGRAGGLDVFEELFAELGESDGGAVVGLAFFVEAHEGAEIFGADLLPVVLVVAAGDGENLNHAAVFGDEREDAVDVEVGIVKGRGNVAEKGFEFGVADFVFLEESEERLSLLRGDFDEVGGDEDLGIVATSKIGDNLGLTLLSNDDGIVGEAGGRNGCGGFGDDGSRCGSILKFVEVFGERRRKFV